MYAQTLQRYIFRILQHFATKLRIFTNFKMLFLTVVIDFVLAWIKVYDAKLIGNGARAINNTN